MKKVLSKKTNPKRFNFAASLILIASLSIFISACSKNDDDQPPLVPPVVDTEITQEIKDLILFKGDENASTVIINAQGGPDTLLSAEEIDFIFSSVDTTDLLVVNVHQAQTLNPDIVKGIDITFDQAVNYNSESIETLSQVIKFFKRQGRTVYIFGASFGAFITQELIARKGTQIADKYLIMIGRLDMNDIMWLGLAEGRFGYFENGITPIVDSEPVTDVSDRNIGRIAAGLGINRYTERLNNVGDLTKVTYVYGTTDELVGSLTAKEVEFLESKNANIIEGSGGHDDTFIDFVAQGFREAFGIE